MHVYDRANNPNWWRKAVNQISEQNAGSADVPGEEDVDEKVAATAGDDERGGGGEDDGDEDEDDVGGFDHGGVLVSHSTAQCKQSLVALIWLRIG